MWSGEGWSRTQRQLGVLFLAGSFVAEVFYQADIPIFFYTIVAGLLGLDLLVEALDRLRGGGPK